jgi:four helix bundle protein
MVTHFKELKVWQKAIALVTPVYRFTQVFPKEEMFGLTSQIRRSAVSVVSNIAEGAARESTKDFLRFLSMTRGSLAELETQILIALDLKYASDADEIFKMIDEVSRMVNGLQKALEEKLATQHSSLAT